MFNQQRWVVQLFLFDLYLTSAYRWLNYHRLQTRLRRVARLFSLVSQGFVIRRNWGVPKKIKKILAYRRQNLTASYRRQKQKGHRFIHQQLLEGGLFIYRPDYKQVKRHPRQNFSYFTAPVVSSRIMPGVTFQPPPVKILVYPEIIYQGLTYFRPPDYDLMLAPRWPRRKPPTRLDTTRHLTPLVVTREQSINFQFLFERFIRQIRPRQARLQKLRELSTWLNQEQSRVVGRPVSVCWRILRYKRHGLINLWLSFIRFRVNQRSVYQIRSIVYPLARQVKLNSYRQQGWHLRCSGRFTRQQRADYKRFNFGYGVKPTSYGYEVDQAFFTFPLKFGSIGLKLTVRY